MTTLKGGEFLIKKTEAEEIFTPEEWNEEQLMIAQSSSDFMEQNIFPNVSRLDDLEEGLMPSLIRKSGELGLLAVTIPEQFGGFGKRFVTGMLVTEVTGAGYSFAVSFSAHTGIGTLPILYYGSEEQKQKYIPKLASGEYLGAYCLTEPESGSDANSGKTSATLSEDGSHYLLNGQKMWITNAGFADIFTVFAKIDNDENLSAFIVERNFEGLSFNPEEKKMGIKGSSTRQMFFNNVRVPVGNLLGERNKGFKIALNILNVGRIKLAGACLGGAKRTVTTCIKYSNERHQFGRPISKYGAIKHKIAEQSIRTFALESAIYRLSKNIEDAINTLEAEGATHEQAILKGNEQFAAEAAILKVYGSEVIDFVTDEGVQIFGGMGYSAEAPMDRAYRDARINRIFEGTNEINRMLIIDMILKKALSGELDLMEHAQKVADELLDIPDFGEEIKGDIEEASKAIARFKKAILLVAGSAAQKLAMSLAKEQEIMMDIADMAIDTYVAESVLLRIEKNKARDNAEHMLNVLNVFVFEAADRIHKSARNALMSFLEGDDLSLQLMGVKRFTKLNPYNCKKGRRNIAEKLIEQNKYTF